MKIMFSQETIYWLTFMSDAILQDPILYKETFKSIRGDSVSKAAQRCLLSSFGKCSDTDTKFFLSDNIIGLVWFLCLMAYQP